MRTSAARIRPRPPRSSAPPARLPASAFYSQSCLRTSVTAFVGRLLTSPPLPSPAAASHACEPPPRLRIEPDLALPPLQPASPGSTAGACSHPPSPASPFAPTFFKFVSLTCRSRNMRFMVFTSEPQGCGCSYETRPSWHLFPVESYGGKATSSQAASRQRGRRQATDDDLCCSVTFSICKIIADLGTHDCFAFLQSPGEERGFDDERHYVLS